MTTKMWLTRLFWNCKTLKICLLNRFCSVAWEQCISRITVVLLSSGRNLLLLPLTSSSQLTYISRCHHLWVYSSCSESNWATHQQFQHHSRHYAWHLDKIRSYSELDISKGIGLTANVLKRHIVINLWVLAVVNFCRLDNLLKQWSCSKLNRRI